MDVLHAPDHGHPAATRSRPEIVNARRMARIDNCSRHEYYAPSQRLEMDLKHIPLTGLPSTGLGLEVADQAVWYEPLQKYAVQCRIAEAVSAEVLLLPQEDGCLIRGKIRGRVVLPCNRCMEDTFYDLDHDFDEFEAFPGTSPGDDAPGSADLSPEESLVSMKDGLLFLDLASLLWEEFSLALPDKPLCKADCKGLCPSCGRNLNLGACGCSAESGDERLAVFRNMKVKRQA